MAACMCLLGFSTWPAWLAGCVPFVLHARQHEEEADEARKVPKGYKLNDANIKACAARYNKYFKKVKEYVHSD